MNELQTKADELIKKIETGECDAKCAEDAFGAFAKYFLGCVVFKSKENGVYRPVEIEMYYHSKNHPDPYVHKNEGQLKNKGFYWHEAGVDVVLGKKNNNNPVFFGVLISGIIVDTDKEDYCYKKIEIHEKIRNCVCDIKLDENSNQKCYRATRVNLNYNVLDTQENPYIARLYRFANVLPANQGMYNKTKFSFYYWLDCIKNSFKDCKEKPQGIERTKTEIKAYHEMYRIGQDAIERLIELGFDNLKKN